MRGTLHFFFQYYCMTKNASLLNVEKCSADEVNPSVATTSLIDRLELERDAEIVKRCGSFYLGDIGYFPVALPALTRSPL